MPIDLRQLLSQALAPANDNTKPEPPKVLKPPRPPRQRVQPLRAQRPRRRS